MIADNVKYPIKKPLDDAILNISLLIIGIELVTAKNPII